MKKKANHYIRRDDRMSAWGKKGHVSGRSGYFKKKGLLLKASKMVE